MSGETAPATGEVQIRFASLDPEAGELARLGRFLSEDELARADRLLSRRKRDRFVAGRGFLRETLATYLDIEPAHLRIIEGEHGKPLLAETGAPLHFNLSHAHDLAVLAIAVDCRVGIDLERVDEHLPYQEIAQRFFAPGEWQELSNLPPHLQLSAFYRFWTRKEAYLKGLGTGFSRPADSFAVSLLPDQPCEPMDFHAHDGEPSPWRIVDVPVPGDYHGALAVEGATPVLRFIP